MDKDYKLLEEELQKIIEETKTDANKKATGKASKPNVIVVDDIAHPIPPHQWQISEADYENPLLGNYVHASSRKIAEDIFKLFREGKRHVVLKAQMQAGKTSIMRHLAYLINVKKGHEDLKIPINSVYVMSAISDTALVQQTKEKLEGVISNPDLFIHHSASRAYKFDTDSSIKKQMSKNRVWFIDESHYGMIHGGRIDHIAEELDDPLSLDLAKMTEHNLFTLHISATPFAELGVNTTVKPIITLVPSDNYFGIQKMLDRNLISDASEQPVFNVDVMTNASTLTDVEFVTRWKNFLDQHETKKGFFIMRSIPSRSTTKKGKVKTIQPVKVYMQKLARLAELINISILQWNEENNDRGDLIASYFNCGIDAVTIEAVKNLPKMNDIDAVLSVAPKNRPVLIIIKGLMKAGIFTALN